MKTQPLRPQNAKDLAEALRYLMRETLAAGYVDAAAYLQSALVLIEREAAEAAAPDNQNLPPGRA